MDLTALIGLVAGSGWAAGINLYAVAAILGLAGRMGWAETPEALQHPAILGAALVMFAVEFGADKVPYLDSIWDVLHTFVRPLGAAAIGYLLADDLAIGSEVAAASSAGVLALISHSAKATARAAVNASPEPASNVVVSLVEDGIVAAVVTFAIANPVVAIVVVTLLTIASIVLVVVLWKVARRAFATLRERWRSRSRV